MAPEVKKTLFSRFQKKSLWQRGGKILAVIALLSLIAGAGVFYWYKRQLEAQNPQASTSVHFTIEKGEVTNAVAEMLEEKRVIKNALAFEWYLRFERPGVIIQSGRYAIKPRLTTPQIVDTLQKGKTNLFNITILPGYTLTDIKKSLIKYSYSAKEVDTAFAASYDHPLLASRPAGHDLEGYIFPESFEIQGDTTLPSLLRRDFDTLYSRLKDGGLLDKFAARGLNLHQALTMASIIQKETSSPEDQKKVAQVLYKRLGMNMKLEVDPTFIYGAKKLGVEPSVSVESPYNTRLHEGLPPGPIANMNFPALEAVANPAATDFLYFVAGDNGKSYFSHTLEEHQDNVKRYCHKLCD